MAGASSIEGTAQVGPESPRVIEEVEQDRWLGVNERTDLGVQWQIQRHESAVASLRPKPQGVADDTDRRQAHCQGSNQG